MWSLSKYNLSALLPNIIWWRQFHLTISLSNSRSSARSFLFSRRSLTCTRKILSYRKRTTRTFNLWRFYCDLFWMSIVHIIASEYLLWQTKQWLAHHRLALNHILSLCKGDTIGSIICQFFAFTRVTLLRPVDKICRSIFLTAILSFVLNDFFVRVFWWKSRTARDHFILDCSFIFVGFPQRLLQKPDGLLSLSLSGLSQPSSLCQLLPKVDQLRLQLCIRLKTRTWKCRWMQQQRSWYENVSWKYEKCGINRYT